MKKLGLLLFAFILFSCSGGGDDETIDEVNNPTHKLELRYTAGDRLTFSQISLPNNVLNVTSPTQTFTLKPLPSTTDVRVSFTYVCSVYGQEYTGDVLVNFYSGQTTVLSISRVVTCSPTIAVIYE